MIKEISFCLYGFKGYIINITLFFGFIFTVLMMIYLFFQPLKVKQQEFVEVPLLEMVSFAMYELNTKGLKTILLGSSSKRFSDRYEVENINYTDNSKEFNVNMKADKGLYKGEKILLDGNVFYYREDGLTFESQEAKYNKKSTILSTDKEYVIYRDKNSIKGKSLTYNNKTNKIKSVKIEAVYQLQEREK